MENYFNYLPACLKATNQELPKNGAKWHLIREGNLWELPQCSERFKKLLAVSLSNFNFYESPVMIQAKLIKKLLKSKLIKKSNHLMNQTIFF